VLASGHHDDGPNPSDADQHEASANAFAAELLLPAAELKAVARDSIGAGLDAASQRRFPLSVQEAHLELIASGAVSRATLAWMLGIDADSLDVDAPEVPEVDVDDLATALGL
jgi:hypothetical protein